MKVFPTDPISIGAVAGAQLRAIRVLPDHQVVGCFDLSPHDVEEYLDRIGGLRNRLGYRYAPTSEVWVSFVVPEDRDDVELLVGIDRRFAEAVERAHRDLHSKASSIVSGLTVRTLALGYLDWAGV